MNRPVVIINGMYRSGTSFLWRILSEDPYYKIKLYEPLHPDILNQSKINDAMRIYNEDKTLTKHWSPDFNLTKIRLKANDRYTELKNYFNDIIRPKTIIKTTRMNLRLGWLLKNFKNIFIINLVRDPRAVCYSYLRRSEQLYFFKQKKIRDFYLCFNYYIKNILKQHKNTLKNTSRYWHNEYLRLLIHDKKWGSYARQFKYSLPPEKILALYRINYQQSFEDLDQFPENNHLLIKFEDFINEPQNVLNNIYNKLNFNEVPQEVLNSINKKSQSLNKILNHNYNRKIDKNLGIMWREIDEKIWKKISMKTDIKSIMKKLKYCN